uniref:AAA+ ATPase domain-containing protein n=1 Tax=Oxyrrhis marina TaxID=2969 RepID=A0A7S4GPA1_OXYMA
MWANEEIKGRWRVPGQNQDRITIQAFNWGVNGRDLIRRLLVHVQAKSLHASERTVDLWHPVRTAGDMEWEIVAKIAKRPTRTVVLQEGIMEDILGDVAKFIERESWYAARNIPHRRGYLLEGPPGCGKTSLIRAVASEFSLPLCCVPLQSQRVGEGGIEALLHRAPEGAIIYIEDIDCAEQGGVLSRTGEQRTTTQESDKRVTMSDILNAIDGLGAQTGRLLFLTTNHPERLDPALLRDGRVDRRFHLGPADREMSYRVFQSIKGDAAKADEAAARHFAEVVPEGCTIAQLQGFLVKHHELPAEEVVLKAQELVPMVAGQNGHVAEQT